MGKKMQPKRFLCKRLDNSVFKQTPYIELKHYIMVRREKLTDYI